MIRERSLINVTKLQPCIRNGGKFWAIFHLRYIVSTNDIKGKKYQEYLGTFSANGDNLAYEKAKSILPKFKEEVKIAMARLGDKWFDWLCDIEELSYSVYKFGKIPLKPFIVKDKEILNKNNKK